MNRTRVRRRRVVAVLALAAGLAAAGPAGGAVGAHGESEARSLGRYVVRPGDTVWAIAADLAGPVADPRPVVEEIARLNGIDAGRLVPGQLLVLPG